MKRFVKLSAIILVAVMCVAAFTACNKHKHDFDENWRNDETQHWHECECGEKSGAVGHTLTYSQTDTGHIATCSVCYCSAGAVNHAFGAGTQDAAKPWLAEFAACVCGQTKAAETDYTKMTLAQALAELSNNEGNFKVDCLDSNNDWECYFETNGKTSYYRASDESGKYVYWEYKLIVGDDTALKYYSLYVFNYKYWFAQTLKSNPPYDTWTYWTDWLGNAFSALTTDDFNADGNTYSLKKEMAGYGITELEITLYKDYIEIKDCRSDGKRCAYTITLGTSALDLSEIQYLHDAVMMFGIAPDRFWYSGSSGYGWYFDNDGVGMLDDLVAILKAQGWTLCCDGYNTQDLTDCPHSACGYDGGAWGSYDIGTHAESDENDDIDEIFVWFFDGENSCCAYLYKNA